MRIYNRILKKTEEEKIYKKSLLIFLYGGTLLGKLALYFAKMPGVSKVSGYFLKTRWSKKKIREVIDYFSIDTSEFVSKDFLSFNDFFTRKILPRTLDPSPAILPADGRYLVLSRIEEFDEFYIKGETFDLRSFLGNENLAKKYHNGSMVICRLAFSDYHRFHFPFDCLAQKAKLINGFLYSVNPFALSHKKNIFSKNKRVMTTLISDTFGDVIFSEIGATNVGTIVQTYTPGRKYKKGDEKGYFSLGGSTIVLLFEENKVVFDDDLIQNSKMKIETKACMGQSLSSSELI